jgi:hypothetical protein
MTDCGQFARAPKAQGGRDVRATKVESSLKVQL